MTREELPTNAKPILFNTEMVRKILAGEKTVTRRVIRFPEGLTGGHQVGEAGNPENPIGLMWACGIKRSRYQPGDILYVRETWARPSLNEINVGADPEKYLYKADSPLQPCAWSKWRPSIHMPKKAARILLRAIDVRAERLQDILEENGKLMVLPCKKGDTLYCATRRQVKPFVVAGFEMFGKSLCVMEKIKRGWKVRLYGTNAFLTEEEAGAHLPSKERAKDEQKQP